MDEDANFKLPTPLEAKQPHKFTAPKKTATSPDAVNLPPKPSEPSAPNASKSIIDANNAAEEDAPAASATPAAAAGSAAPPKKAPTVPCPYTEPKWSAAASPEHAYSIEMLKGGIIVETVGDLQTQPFWVIGKLTSNDIVMAHPTVSRYHAVLQYRPEIVPAAADEAADDDAENPTAKPQIACGWYLYDLGSTHGSFVNKRKVPAKTYVRVRVGYMLSFGASTRRLILQGPDHDADAESELSISEMKAARAERAAAAAELVRQERDRALEVERKRESDGISWGMAEDADEETDLSVNPYATTNNEELFLQDPKKTLRGYFEREGLDLEYKVDELSAGSFVCKIVLPLSDSNGRAIVCEVSHKGKKKECVVQGALEACRVLDRHGVLRQSHHESRKRKVANSDSDGDDDFYDRTGAVARKREEKEAVQQTKAFSYEELLEQERELLAKLDAVNGRIEHYQQLERRHKESAKAEHDLDDFMTQLSDEKFDKTDIRRLRVEAKSLEAEHHRLQRLIRIARPVNLPPLVAGNNAAVEKKKLALPLFGKRGTFKFATKAETVPQIVKPPNEDDPEEVVDDDETMMEPSSDSISIAPAEADCVTAEKAPVSVPSMRKKEENTQPIAEINATHQEPPKADAVEAASSKKKRNRPRLRGERARDNIDIDEPAELLANTEKCSTWLPPENQSGDGNTRLNEKFGY